MPKITPKKSPVKVTPSKNGTVKKAVAEVVPELPILELLIYSALREDTTKPKADAAFNKLKTSFFDWNEIRVSAARDVARPLTGLPESMDRAERIIHVLQEVFETTYSFDLEPLHKKGIKQAQKQLERFHGTTRFMVNFVLKYGLGSKSIKEA